MAVLKAANRVTCDIKLKVNGRWVRFAGVKDRSTSEKIEGRIGKLITAKTHHEPLPDEVLTWVRDLPTRSPRLFQKLVEHGLADASLLGRRKLTDLLLGIIEEKPGFDDALKSYSRNGAKRNQARRRVLALRQDLYECKSTGYLQTLLADGDTPGHVVGTVSRIDAALTGCEFGYWDDLNAERIKQWLHQQRTTRPDFGTKTSNHYIKAMRSFAAWCKRQLKRGGEPNPFDDVELLNTSDDVRRKRRAATADEIERIVRATKSVGELKHLPAEDRAMLYRVALTLAPRASECASLVSESFVTDDDGMRLVIEPGNTKNRKEAKIPVPKTLAEILKPWLAKKPKGQRLWPGKWYRNGAEMLREDLSVAGVEYETKDGFLDFHATRHTAITRGSRVMPVVDLKTFARHAKIETTMRYVHTDEKQLRDQVELLPLIGAINPTPRTSDAKKSDHKCDHASGSTRQHASSRRTQSPRSGNDTTPCMGKGLSSSDSDCHQRGRRGSNPQPPDRQSGTLTN
jgi:integrase